MTTSASTAPNSSAADGLRIPRRYTSEDRSVYDQFTYARRRSVIRNPAGDTVFEMNDVDVPEGWSQVATDILAQKYFRKAGVPQPDGSTGSETSVQQVVHRLVDCWRAWGVEHGYFASDADGQAFADELAYMLLAQVAAPNSPQWFNTGLHHAYGIEGPAQGHWYVDPKTGRAKQSTSAYERPQPHACFILSVEDDLVNPGGIMDLWVREARIFKYGSGVGTNFSNIRSEQEPLSGGGQSSGLMSFLLVGDRAAGAIKSGGTTRRAAKMVILDMDHPEVERFIGWKVREEQKVKALMDAGFDGGYEGEAYRSVSGQNSNNSVRVNDAFMRALLEGREWHTRNRANGEVAGTYQATELWHQVADAAWRCADPGVQFHTTINDWHTCPADGDIRASNPCSEYMFLDNTACNLASLNLRKFQDPETGRFDTESFEHAVRLWTIVLEISVLMAQFPSKEIAERSYKYRTLGLGYANLGSLLMVGGQPYDTDKARATAGAITALLTAKAYETSAEMAAVKGPFPAYEKNKADMLRVIRNHRYAAYNADEYENLHVRPMGIDQHLCEDYLLSAACNAWDRALQLGEVHGYRNAQASVLAPTGTIGLLMDCDTTGVEPDFALIKFKKLAGGGYFKIVNQSVPPALRALGYTEEQIRDITHYMKGHGSLNGAPGINRQRLLELGLTEAELDTFEEQLPAAFDLNFVINPWNLGENALERLGIAPDLAGRPGFNLLKALGFSQADIDTANTYICGAMTVEGAPHLKEEHYPIFDTANKNGRIGQRFIHPHGHLRMMAAAQPFISGAISKTINMPNEATVEEVEAAYRMGWELSLKAISIYRDGSKLSQPLSTSADAEDSEEEESPEGVVATQGSSPKEAARRVIELSQKEILQEVQKILNQKTDTTRFKDQLKTMVVRHELPSRRHGITQKAKVGGQTLFVRTGEYEDGSIGEIFIDMHKEGAMLRSMLNSFAIAVSIGLQYGVPLEEFVDKFAFARFEPAGYVQGHANIKSATSILDYIFRHLAYEYLDRQDLVQVQPSPEDPRSPANPPAPEEPGSSANPGNTPTKQGPSPSGANNPPAHENSAEAAANPQQKGVQQLNENLMGDAPSCNICGHITIRSGTCYKCMNCGNSMGCS